MTVYSLSTHPLFTVTDQFPALLLDAFGVFWGGNSMGCLPGAKEAMKELVSQGKIVGILSNSTQLSFKEIEKLKAHGLLQDTHFHFIHTSGDAAKHFFSYEELPFKTPQKKYYLFGGKHLKPSFSSLHQSIFQESRFTETESLYDADFIYASTPHINGEDQTKPELFQEMVDVLIKTALPMVCANPDRFAHEGVPPRAVVRQGSIAALYEALGGKVFYIGKPYPKVYETATTEFRIRNITDPSSILMIGDTPETDIRGARKACMKSALLTKTGIMGDRVAHHGFDKAIQNLPEEDYPDFLIERMSIHHDI